LILDVCPRLKAGQPAIVFDEAPASNFRITKRNHRKDAKNAKEGRLNFIALMGYALRFSLPPSFFASFAPSR